MCTKLNKWVIAVVVISVVTAVSERIVEFLSPEWQERFHRANESFVESVQQLDPQKISRAWFEALYGVHNVGSPSPSAWEAPGKYIGGFEAAAEPILAGGPVSVCLAVVVLLTGVLLVTLAGRSQKSDKTLGYIVGYVLFTPIYGAIFVKILLAIVLFVDHAFTGAVDLAATIAGLHVSFWPLALVLRAIFKEREHHITSTITHKVTSSVLGNHPTPGASPTPGEKGKGPA